MREHRYHRGSQMPYIYPLAATLERSKKVGNLDCVALVRHDADVPDHTRWKPGEAVVGSTTIKPGTAIATFVKGRYLNQPTGNHAAFYLRHQPGGIWIIDQWKHPTNKPYVTARFIKAMGGPRRDGNWLQASDNASAFFIIEPR
jgi:hypothetical protein